MSEMNKIHVTQYGLNAVSQNQPIKVEIGSKRGLTGALRGSRLPG